MLTVAVALIGGPRLGLALGVGLAVSLSMLSMSTSRGYTQPGSQGTRGPGNQRIRWPEGPTGKGATSQAR